MAATTGAEGPPSRIVPPADLLEQVSGIEEALRRGRHLGVAGWVALVLSLAQAGLALYAKAASLNPAQWLQQLLVVGAVVCFGLAVALTNWTRFWVRESKRPFRYTYSIADFVDVDDGKSSGAETMPLQWLRTDLATLLSRRIDRLSRLADGDAAAGATTRSHIHISGTYVLKESASRERWYEVVPWIRVGAPDRPATLAHPVTYRMAGETWQDAYAKLVERIYFSIATEIYQRIHEDVERKIGLLPLRSFRAAAYFHEAEDYVRSNTLEAYDGAQDLYLNVIRIYDPDWFALPESPPLRLEKLVARGWARATRSLAITGSKFWPRLARNQLMIARAYVGYASVLVYRRTLARLAGQRVNPMFEARPAVGRALQRLERLPDQVRGKREAMFDALVTRALIRDELDSPERAFDALQKARCREPIRSEQDARWLFARGFLEPRPLQRLQFLRRSVEIDDRFEVAQYALAVGTEHRWRMRATLDKSTARMAFEEYGAVHDLNPGNIAAWSNHAYMLWLLDEPDDAERHYRRGLEYKKIKRATFVAQLDSGMVRITAERGDFVEAYHHYIAATSSVLAVGVAHGQPVEQVPELIPMTPALMARYERYLGRVEEHARLQSTASEATRRLINSVLAFVLTDFGRACYQYYTDTCDSRYLQRAKDAFARARSRDLGGRYVLPHYYSHLLARDEPDYDGRHIQRAHELDENWVDGGLEFVLYGARRGGFRKRIAAAQESAKRHRRAAEVNRQRAHSVRAQDLDATTPATRPAADGETAGAAGWDAEELIRKAVEEEAAAGRQDAEVRRLQALLKRSDELVRKLLPHEWLWRDEKFDTRALRSRRFGRELRWEREFDDVHANTLYAVSTSWDSGDDSLAALEHIRKHFWAADHRMLFDAMQLTRGTADWKKFADRLKSLADAWIKFDTAYWTLSWLRSGDEVDWIFSPDEAVDRLLLGPQRFTFPPSLAIWTAGQLEALGRRDRAVELYDEAARVAGRAGRHDLLLDAAGRLRGLSECRRAEQAYRLALGMVSANGPADEAIECHVGLALCMWENGREELALQQLRLAAGLDLAGQGWRKRFVEEATMAAGRDGARDRDRSQMLHAWAASELRLRRGAAEAVRADSQDALLHLSSDGRRYVQDGQEATDLARYPIVTPIRLDGDPAFFPNGADSPGVKRLIDEGGIERARQEIEQRFGVAVPGVRIRADDRLTSGAYEVLVDEVPVVWGRADPAEPWAETVLADLRLVFRRHLGSFLGVQEVTQRLSQMGDRYSRLRGRALPDVAALCRFTRVLRLLVARGASIADLAPILHVFARARGADLDAIAERARACLGAEQLGLSGSLTFMRFPAASEERIVRAVAAPGGRVSGLPAMEELVALAGLLRELAADHGRPVLVTRDDRIRPALAALAVGIDRQLTVVSAREVSRSGYAEPIDYVEVR